MKIQYGDLLITMTGSGANQINSAVGQVGRYYDSKMSLLNQRVCKIETSKPEYSEYIYQFISLEDTQMELLNGSTGSANQANISPDQIKGLSVLKPDKSVVKKFQKIAIIMRDSIKVEVQTKLFELGSLILAKMTKIGNQSYKSSKMV